MGIFGTILITILVFGFLIFIHEFGHYITARIFHVTINEFSIGILLYVRRRYNALTHILYYIFLKLKILKSLLDELKFVIV